MSESKKEDAKVTESSQTPESGLKDAIGEVKSLVWVTVITIWLVACLIMVTGSWNYQAIEKSSALLDEFSSVRSHISSTAIKVNQSVEKGLGTQSAMAEKFREQLLNDIARLTDAAEEMVAEQKRLSVDIREQVSQGTDRMNTSADQIIRQQEALVKAMNDLMLRVNSLHNSERMKVLRKFIENQTLMLNKLSEAMEPPKKK